MEAYTRVDTDVVTGLRQPLEGVRPGPPRRLVGAHGPRHAPAVSSGARSLVQGSRSRVVQVPPRSVDRFAAAVDRLTGLGWLDR